MMMIRATSSWLKRASTVLSENRAQSDSCVNEHDFSDKKKQIRSGLGIKEDSDTETEKEAMVYRELKEVAELLHEAPSVMEFAASLMPLSTEPVNNVKRNRVSISMSPSFTVNTAHADGLGVKDQEKVRTPCDGRPSKTRKRSRQDSWQIDVNGSNDFRQVINEERFPDKSQIDQTQIQQEEQPQQLRRGKWTQEEEAYVLCLVRDFNDGLLDEPPGITLRTFLSQTLRCDPMRITKKFTGDSSIGKKVYHPNADQHSDTIKARRVELKRLQDAWNLRMAQQEQEAAAAALAKQITLISNLDITLPEEVKLTAVWLDRASSLLIDTATGCRCSRSSSSPTNVLDSTTCAASCAANAWYLANLEQIQQLLSESTALQERCERLPQLFKSFISTASANNESARTSKTAATVEYLEENQCAS